jgi:hypothetical protein
MGKRLSQLLHIVLAAFIALPIVAGSFPRDVAAQASPSAPPVPDCVEGDNPARTPSPTLSELSTRRLELVLATEALIRCRGSEDWMAIVTRMQPQLLERQVGTSDLQAAAETMASLHEAGFLVPFDVETIGEPTVTTTFGSINLTTREGYVLRRQEWVFALEPEGWMLSTMTESPPLLDMNAVGIPVTLDAAGLSTTRTALVDPGTIVFDIINTLDQASSFALFRIDGTGGSNVRSDILQGVPPDPASVIGWTEALPGETRSLVLVELPVGNYLLVGGYDPRLGAEPVVEAAIVQVTIEESG